MAINVLHVMIKAVQYSFIFAGGAALLTGICLYAFQLNLIYPSNMPEGSRTEVALPSTFGMPDYEEVWLETPDGEKLHCYQMRHKDHLTSRPTVIQFIANAGNIGHRLPITKVLHDQMKLNVFMLSYRGYGKSTGKANEKGLKIDADTALEHILQHPQLSKTKLFVYGQSIGGAVSIYITAKNQGKISGLILENTFLSIRSLIPTVLPIARPIARFCHQQWSSDRLIDTLETPILFLSGLQDELVPKSQMKALFELAKKSEKREWKEFPNGTHNDTVMQEGYMQTVYDFIEKVAA